MDYWINTDNVQKGPYTLEQLRLMWCQGNLPSTTYYYDGLRLQWLLLQDLVESTQKLFTIEEAFVRLGQNRQRGCLAIYNHEEALHVFVDGGWVVCTVGRTEQGEFALSRALGLDNSNYDWFRDAVPPAENMRVNITEYALRHSISRDVRIGNQNKKNTVALPRIGAEKSEPQHKFDYVLVPKETPTVNIRLTKWINVVGREDHCDVVLNNQQVSRKHCLLEVWEHNVKIKDLDSSNGTYVNGASVQDGFLKVGDQLSLGSYQLFLRKEQKKAPNVTG